MSAVPTLHTSLDVVEEKLANTTKTAGADNRELYLGALYSSEHQEVFGYVTNTRIKFIIITDTDTTVRDYEIRQVFRKLHTPYTNIMANPFYMPGRSSPPPSLMPR